MRLSYFIVLWTVPALFFTGCHFFEDSENVDECTLNSGYPCPCVPDAAHFTCADGDSDYCCEDGLSRCIFTEGNENRGICTLPCNGAADTQSCIRTKGYGSEGLCAMAVVGSTSPKYCEVICDPSGDECPPGMDCFSGFHADFSVCNPENEP